MRVFKGMGYILLWSIIFLVSGAQASLAEPITYSLTPENVVVEIAISPDQTHRVWTTQNPMKVIVDINGILPNLASSISVKDVALQQIRTTVNKNTNQTRVVLDFLYHLPDVHWENTKDKLVITANKLFVRSSLLGVTPGVRYGHERRGSVAGPLIVNYLEIDILNPEIELRTVLAQDRILGNEHVSNMAIRSEAIAAVNGAYFASDGRPLGLLAIQGELISEPYAKRTAIGLGKSTAVIDAVDFSGRISLPSGATMAVTGMNRPRLQDDLIVYNSHYGETTNTNIYGIDVILEDNIVMAIHPGNVPIPPNGMVLSGHGKGRDFLMELALGDRVIVDVELTPDWLNQGITEIIGGGPRLVRNGIMDITGEQERFQRDILIGRAPRTALGLTSDGKLLLVTVNGRKPGISVGMTLEELASLMIELGAVDAMNLDGGGSTTMVIRDMVLNLPSDGVERRVSNSLVIITPESRR